MSKDVLKYDKSWTLQKIYDDLNQRGIKNCDFHVTADGMDVTYDTENKESSYETDKSPVERRNILYAGIEELEDEIKDYKMRGWDKTENGIKKIKYWETEIQKYRDEIKELDKIIDSKESLSEKFAKLRLKVKETLYNAYTYEVNQTEDKKWRFEVAEDKHSEGGFEKKEDAEWHAKQYINELRKKYYDMQAENDKVNKSNPGNESLKKKSELTERFVIVNTFDYDPLSQYDDERLKYNPRDYIIFDSVADAQRLIDTKLKDVKGLKIISEEEMHKYHRESLTESMSEVQKTIMSQVKKSLGNLDRYWRSTLVAGDSGLRFVFKVPNYVINVDVSYSKPRDMYDITAYRIETSSANVEQIYKDKDLLTDNLPAVFEKILNKYVKESLQETDGHIEVEGKKINVTFSGSGKKASSLEDKKSYELVDGKWKEAKESTTELKIYNDIPKSLRDAYTLSFITETKERSKEYDDWIKKEDSETDEKKKAEWNHLTATEKREYFCLKFYNELFIKFVKEKLKEEGYFKPNSESLQENEGVSVELEHKPTFDWIRTELEATGKVPSDEDIAQHIEEDHKAEFGDAYYPALAEMEAKLKAEQKPKSELDSKIEKLKEALKSKTSNRMLPEKGVAQRSKVSPVFDSKDKKVKDNKDHFPLGSLSQAKNAWARVNQYDKVPSWYDGTLDELKKKVKSAIKKAFPSYEPGESKESIQLACKEMLNLIFNKTVDDKKVKDFITDVEKAMDADVIENKDNIPYLVRYDNANNEVIKGLLKRHNINNTEYQIKSLEF